MIRKRIETHPHLELREMDSPVPNGHRHYELIESPDEVVGKLLLSYSKRGKVAIQAVDIDERLRGKGVGMAIYDEIPHLQPPAWAPLQGLEFTFVSNEINDNSTAVWERLVAAGRAKKVYDENGRATYEHLNSQAASMNFHKQPSE